METGNKVRQRFYQIVPKDIYILYIFTIETKSCVSTGSDNLFRSCTFVSSVLMIQQRSLFSVYSTVYSIVYKIKTTDPLLLNIK